MTQSIHYAMALLAQAPAGDSAPPVNWPWFIIGCVLLLVAIVAFFWAFKLGKLTEGQHFLLMWILPLSSGFAAGSFMGSLQASGPIGQLTVAATGGFAVWLLSYKLLPKPSRIAPPSMSIKMPPNKSLRQAATLLAEQDGYTVAFNGLDDAILNAKIKEGQMTAAGPMQLIEQLQHRFVDESVRVTYRVTKDSNRGLYQIDKT
jgi:hypothetical protein